MNNEYPKELKYSENHLWIKEKENSNGSFIEIGITNFVAKSIKNEIKTDIFYFLDLFKTAEIISKTQDYPKRKGDLFGKITKNTFDFFDLIIPITGIVSEVNIVTVNDVIKNPYEEWLIKMTLTDPNELERLKSSAVYNL